MRKTILAGALALGAILGSARPAQADCLSEAVSSCNDDFGGANNYYTIAIRGWCYMIRGAMCSAMD
ncbi:MAG TPA: hypothetical protein VHM30_14540 [Gemmatimonadaceae bacterium]|nr:hypothetical protein [Gemmatimonadaceae bacterium]